MQREMAASRRAGAPWFLSLETIAGDQAEITVIEPIARFADVDATEHLAKQTINREVVSRRFHGCLDRRLVVYGTPLVASEIRTSETPVGRFWIETRIQPLQGKRDDYLAWLREDYRPGLEKAGVQQFWVWIAVFGGNIGEIDSMRQIPDLTDIDKGSILSRGLTGEEASVVGVKGASLVQSGSTHILRKIDRLSYP